MTKLYSIYDQANLGVSLQLSNSDQVVTTTVPGLSINRMVRCLYSLDVFPGNVEWMVFGTGSLTNLALVGVVDSSAVTTKYVGQDTHGYGYKPSDGKLYNNGAAVATWTTSAKDDIIAMAYNAADFSLSFYRGSASTGFVLLGSYTLPADTSGITGPWYPAASLGSTAAGDQSIWFNAGQQAFQYPLPGGDGWWIQTAQINPVRIASEDFTSPDTDSIPNAVFDGAISSGALTVVRGISPWVWREGGGGISGGQSYGTLTIDDPNELYGPLLSADIRDEPITLARTQAQKDGGSVDSAQVLATGVIDSVQTAGDFQKTITIKDGLAILDQPVQRSRFLPNVDPSAVGRPLPIVAGGCYSVPGILIKTSPYTYQFADMPITQIVVRVAGKIMAFGVDCYMTPDARGIYFDAVLYPNGPQGKVTADVSTVGGSVVGLTDLLAALTANYTGTASGTDTYTSSATPTPSGYTTGDIYKITFTNANTGASTLNDHSHGAKAIKLDGAALTAGQIPAGSTLFLRYNGTSLDIVGSSLGWDFTSYSSSADLTRNATSGGYFSNRPAWAGSGTDPTYAYPRLEMGPEGGSGTGTYIKTKSNVCRAGYSYVAKIAIEHIPAQNINTTMPAFLFVGVDPTYLVNRGLASVFNPYYVNYGVDSYGSPEVSLVFTNTTGAAAPFVLGFQANNVAGTHGVGLAKIASAELYELPLASSVVNLTGMGLEDYCRLIIETEGGLSPSVWNSADAAAIDAACGYTSIGNYIGEATTIRNALQPVLDSYCADLFIDRSGVIRIVRLEDPGALVSSGTIDESVILGPVNANSVETGVQLSAPESMIAESNDLAPGLTTKFGNRRNWSPYTDGDFGSTSLTDCPNAVRAALKQTFQSIAASGTQLSRSYLYAQQREPMPTCFGDPAEAQTECDRVCALYTSLRKFNAVPLKSDDTDAYEIGQAWQLVYTKYGLSAGLPTLIAGITEDAIKEQLTETSWR